MYMNTLAFTFALAPPSAENGRRTTLVTLLHATGAIVGWPFALALAIPFVFEELFILGADRVAPSARATWTLGRWKRLVGAGLAALLIFVSVSSTLRLPSNDVVLDPSNLHRHRRI
jgi:alpha-1,2-mannosyltransferase